MIARLDPAGGRHRRTLVLLLALPLVGALGFMLVEGWGFLDSLYMAMMTLTTVGFSEVHPLGTAGRVFVMAYMTVGLGVFLYGAVQIGEALLRGQLLEHLGSRRMDAELKSLKDHFIICGFGRMGRELCRKLAHGAFNFVVIDKDAEVCARATAEGWRALTGDATDDTVLQGAGVERARGLAAVLSGDSENLYVVMSARLLQPRLQILARATDEKSHEKMRRAGADRVVNIYETGAHKMAQLLGNASLEDFIEIMSTPGNQLDVAQFTVPADAEYRGRTLAESGFSERRVMIVGIEKPGRRFQIPPPSAVPIEEGDRLIALGKAADLTGILPRT